LKTKSSRKYLDLRMMQ